MPFVYEHRCDTCGFASEILDGSPGVIVGDNVRALPWPDARSALGEVPATAPRVNIERYACLDCGTWSDRVRDVHPQPWAGCVAGFGLAVVAAGAIGWAGRHNAALGASTMVGVALLCAVIAPLVDMQRLEAGRRTWRSERPCAKCGGQDLLRPRDCPSDLPCQRCGAPAMFRKLRRVGPAVPPGRDYRS
jgi:hypothetical protein